MKPQAAEATVTKTCRCRRFRSKQVCGELATVRVTAGCIHEHIGTATVCETHAGQLTAGGVISCPACRDGADSHRCPVLGRRTS